MTIRLKRLVELHDIVMKLKEVIGSSKIEDIAVVEKRSIIREGKRFKIYLPTDENPFWKHLYENHYEVDVIIVIKRRGKGDGG